MMLCKKAERTDIESLEKQDFLFSEKIDGDRCLFQVENGKVLLQNRRGVNITYKYPELNSLTFKDNFLLDGEIAVENKDFYSGIAKRSHLQNEELIRQRAIELPITFYAFDILKYNGVDLQNRTLMDRYSILKDKVPKNESIRVLGLFTKGVELWNDIEKREKEGIIAKYKYSTYSWDKRSNYWLKIKRFKETEIRFDGYETHPKGITLTDSINGYRCACNGRQSLKVQKIIENMGYVIAECQYLNREKSGRYRHISFRGVK